MKKIIVLMIVGLMILPIVLVAANGDLNLDDASGVTINSWGDYSIQTNDKYLDVVEITSSDGDTKFYMTEANYNLQKYNPMINPQVSGSSGLYKTPDAAKKAAQSQSQSNSPLSTSSESSGGPGAAANEAGIEMQSIYGENGAYSLIDKKSGLMIVNKHFSTISGGEVPGDVQVYVTENYNLPNAESGAGELNSLTYKSVNSGGIESDLITLKWNGFNYDCIGSGCDNSLVGERIKNKVNFDHYLTSFRLGLGWGKISSLFGMDDEFSEWKFQVDSFFYKSILLGGSDVWVEHICYMSSDMEGVDNAIFSANEDGLLVQSSAITATKQFIQNPNSTNQWLYRVTYFIRNPEASGSGGFSELLGGSDDDGLIARGSTSTNTEGLSSDEKKLWNIVKKSSEKISNAVGKTSRTAKASDEPIMFNLYFSGERDFWLYDEDQEVDVGDEILYTGSDSFASYSEYNYNQVCIKFTDGEMIDAFYEEHSELCTTIKEVGSSTSYIDIDLETSSSSSSSSSSSTSQRSTF